MPRYCGSVVTVQKYKFVALRLSGYSSKNARVPIERKQAFPLKFSIAGQM